MIEAGKFAKPVRPLDGDGSFVFGIEKAAAVTQLRRLADMVESGEVNLQKVQTGQVASYDDWCFEAVMIEFVTRRQPGTNELYGAEGKFPLAIARQG